jgi:hypothetical protein
MTSSLPMSHPRVETVALGFAGVRATVGKLPGSCPMPPDGWDAALVKSSPGVPAVVMLWTSHQCGTVTVTSIDRGIVLDASPTVTTFVLYVPAGRGGNPDEPMHGWTYVVD